MTTSTLHTPLEELLFFQSLRANGVSSESFSQISETLKANEFIHSSEDFEPERLSPGNLKLLYLRLLKDEARSSRQTSPKQDGDLNGRKRKLSTPPLQSIDEAEQHAHLLPRLVDRLYARYQSHLVEAIKEDEKVYFETCRTIEEIERGECDARLQAEEATKSNAHNSSIQDMLRAETRQADAVDSKSQARGSSLPKEDLTIGSRQQATTPVGVSGANDKAQSHISKATTVPENAKLANNTQPQSHASSPARQEVPSLSDSQKSNASAPPTGGVTLQGKQVESSNAGTQPSNGPQRSTGSPAVALDNLSEKSTRPYTQTTPQQSPRHGQLPNLPPHPQSLPQSRNFSQSPYSYQAGQPQYNQYPLYGQPVPGYPTGPLQNMPPYVTPSNQPFQPNNYPPSSSGQYPPQATYNTFPGYPQNQQPLRPTGAPQFSTPTQPNAIRKQVLTPINTAVSATKWKSTPRQAGKPAPRSPTPPERSPMLPSSPEPSPEPEYDRNLPSNKSYSKVKDTPSRVDSTPTRGRGRGRWGSHSARGRGGRHASTPHDTKDTPTRSQSVASTAEEFSTETATRRSMKHEQPSTPLPITDDTSAMSTPGSANRPGRRNTLRGLDLARPGTKRKRANTMDGSPEPVAPTTPHIPVRPGYVLASRNFPRIVAPLMNDINSHKLASLFAKPITERDAPGYHGLIHRATDLKSIRAAISHGSRTLAASAVLDSSLNASADESAAAATPPTTGTPTASVSVTKSGNLWVERGPDVIPPRGIVNSAQLEKEITRIFANAVMFNADSHRGFGRLLNRRRSSASEDDEDNEGDDEEEGVEGHYEVDDGGAFVRDAREMFEDIERSVTRWRAAERVDRGSDTRARGGEGKDESEADDVVEDEGESSRGRRARG